MSKLKPTKKLDCLGFYCPQPVFETRSSIDELEEGEVLEVKADDPAAEEDIKALIEALGEELLDFHKDGTELTFIIRKKKR